MSPPSGHLAVMSKSGGYGNHHDGLCERESPEIIPILKNTMNKERKRIQVISMFLNLHTLARNVKKYTPLDKDTKAPVSEEMRRLDFYVREIERHNGRDLMREILKGTYVEKA